MGAAFLYFSTSILLLVQYIVPVRHISENPVAPPADYVVFTFDTTNAPNLGDSGFLVFAYCQNSFEIRAARLAHKQSGDPKVRATALAIKKDHDILGNTLQLLLTKRGYGLPQPTDELRAKYKYLNGWMGLDFNTRYATGNAADANGDITFYTSFLQNTKDTELKNFASNALTVLKADKDSVDRLIVYINTQPKTSW